MISQAKKKKTIKQDEKNYGKTESEAGEKKRKLKSESIPSLIRVGRMQPPAIFRYLKNISELGISQS
ncbi:protein of unknown function [Xenorhabdus doucetiae]|uniref:Uncharacterized protein n=1 Tax=Xenorhabdus doucetiae TaxID=351671 RepID=A0A068QMJ8_9GAMM|nr:protein of unknown function [Xenorhabdus doucetiae]